MASLSEIEKLEARWAENPEGRYFAPLADAYRKAGRLDDALQRIQQGLEKHPEYVSAFIVLGRINLDKKDDPAARETFEKVLSLDSENIIALKSLAEISERMNTPLDARKWLQQLLVIDPTNLEAESDLRRLGGPLPADAPAAEEAAAESSSFSFADEEAAPPASVTEAATVPMPAIDVSEAPTAPMIGIDAGALPGVDEVAPVDTGIGGEIMPFDDSLQWGAGERTSRAIHAEDIEAAEHAAADTTAAIEFMGQSPPVPPAAELPTIEMTPIRIDQPAAAPEPEPAPAAAASVWESAPEIADVDLDATPAEPVPEPAPEPVHAPGDLPLIMPEDVTPAEEMSRPSVKMVAMVSPEPEEAAEDAHAAPMLTETMGDLYLKQGFRAEAANVYRELLKQRPDDASLKTKLAILEAPPPSMSASALGAEPVGSWLRRIARANIGAPSAPPAAGAEDGGASPMEQAFGEAEAPAGEPARPGSDSYSLDRVFGEEGAAAAGGVPAAAAPSSGGSFDEFFGSAPPAEPAAAPKTDAGTSPGGGAQDDDLGSFNAWLHGLKK